VHVIGTAGHVDHGKSSLVRALTGTDPDRWLEEQLRGMTLDLGFAHLRFADGVEAGIVDVPGHERFVHNMLAGAAGMELLLLVVAANEGVRPQTREHLAILDLLGVARTMIVITKRDLVDDETLRAVETDVRAAVHGTVAADAAAYAVSTLSGAGMDAFRTALHDTLAALPAREAAAPVVLPVDRAFALSGAGTIVTGTLLQGVLRTGDTLLLDPPGRTVRVRTLQVFGERRERVDAGARVAVNVPGIEVAQTGRGATLADAALPARDAFAVRVRAVDDDARALLRRRTPVRVAIGAAEILGTLVFAVPPVDCAPVDATLHLRRAVVTFSGQPFIVRSLSPKRVLGGGTIGAAMQHDDLADPVDADSPLNAPLLRVLMHAGLAPVSVSDAALAANVREDVAAADLLALAGAGRALALARPLAYVDGAAADAFAVRVRDVLERRETEAPWTLGVTLLALARELTTDEPFLLRVLAAFAERGELVARAGYYATPEHRPTLSAAQRDFFARVAPEAAAGSLIPVPLEGIVEALRRERIPGVQAAFDTLLATGTLVKVGGDVYRGTQIATIRERMIAAIRAGGPLTAARFRDAIGTSRKFAVPLLEWFDTTGVTVRDGDLRTLRKSAAP